MMADQSTAAARSVKDLRILLVEDDSFTRTLITRMLQEMDVRDVKAATDGVHALELLRANPEAYDLLICDLEMPRMGGLDLLHALRTLGGTSLSNTPVIVLTGHREAETVKRAITYGISGYLVKPVAKTDLIKRLTFALQKGR